MKNLEKLFPTGGAWLAKEATSLGKSESGGVMDILTQDIETFSDQDLTKTGVYRYVESSAFEVMLLSFALNDGPVQVVDLTAGEQPPDWYVKALSNPKVLKAAFNANFERTCLAKHFGVEMPPEQWRCTSVLALTLGLPGRLGDVARVCGLPEDKQKMGIGAGLIRYFCIPCKPTKKNGERTRNLPHHEPARWQLFKEYCARDVEVEREIRNKLCRWAPNETEQRFWALDQRINDRGMRVDMQLVEAAIAIDDAIREKLTAEFLQLTGIAKATQVGRLKKWLEQELDTTLESLNKEDVKAILKTTDDDAVRRAIALRQQLSKSSVAKYRAIARSVCSDNRVRGLLQFYGANRTGRFAGRIVQIQNLPKSDLGYGDLKLARELVKARDVGTLALCFGSVPGILSELIRTVFIPSPGKVFAVVDFSAVEARGLAWGAQEPWRLEVFRTHGKIYEASAEQMFKLPKGSVDKRSPYRQRGKVAELALGYQGAAGALITMGALKMGLTEEDLPGLVKAWRDANPNVKQLWWDMERDAKRTVQAKRAHGRKGFYMFSYESGMLFLELPSGRKLVYAKPKVEKGGDFENVTYDGLNQETKQWQRIESYGGKWVENWCQATCRDVLRDALLDMDNAGIFDIVGHVHDEAIAEVDAPVRLHAAEEIFGRGRPWAPGLPLKGDGFVSDFYRKDNA